VLRPSLVPSLLAARSYNEAHGSADARLFEIAPVYLPRPGRILPDEPTRLALVGGLDFLGLKGVVEALLARFHVDQALRARPAELPPFVPGRAAELVLGRRTWASSARSTPPGSPRSTCTAPARRPSWNST
jgi:phenylalanyl-tRNA synthetase beta chain